MATSELTENFYDEIKPELHQRIIKEFHFARRIVDAGCGNCELARLLSMARKDREVVAVDISGKKPSEMTGSSRKLHFRKADARKMQFLAKNAMDAIVAMYAFHEFAAPMAVLREAKRILRPGGEILLVDFPPDSLAQRLWNERYYWTGELTGMLKRAGFVRVQARRIINRQITWARGFKN